MKPPVIASHVVVPSSVVLTAKTLSSAMRKLSTADLEAAIEQLVDELNARLGDPDMEPDHDGEEELAA